MHEQRREEHRHPRGEEDEGTHDQRELEPAEHRVNARGQGEDQDDDQVQAEVEHRQQNHRGGDHKPWEVDLAQQVLAVHHAADSRRRSFGEKLEQDDRTEQLHAVELGFRRRGVVDMPDLREEDPDHAEQQQGAHQRPQVAQDRAEEAQLEFGPRQGEGQRPEPPQVAAQGGGPVDVMARGAAGQRQAGRGTGAHECSIRISIGSSRMPPLELPWMTIEAMSSTSASASSPVPSRAREGVRV